MPDIFLSYSREDQAIARRYAEALAQEGLDVWWDQTLRSGEAYDEVTEEFLRGARAVVVLWSPRSVKSRWVRSEATIGDRNGALVPVMIEDCSRPVMFELMQTADLSRWKGDRSDPAWQSLVADVRNVVAGGHLPHSTVPRAGARADPAWRTPWVRSALKGLLIAGLATGSIMAWQRFGASHGEAAAPAPTAPSAAVPLRILVLPFVNQSADPEQDYFANGLTETLLAQLNQIRALRPFGRGTTFSFKDQDVNALDVSQRLGVHVDYLLEGSVLKGARTVRVIPQLVDTRDGTQLPLKTYERELADMDALQQDIATDVAKAVGVVLAAGDLPPALGGTRNAEAYDYYLRALDEWRKGTDNLARVVPPLRKAFELDPSFGVAGQSLTLAVTMLAAFQPPAAAEELWRERLHVQQQLSTLPEEWQRSSAFGVTRHSGVRHWKEAIAALEFLRGVTDYAGLSVRGIALAPVGRLNDAIPEFRSSIESDPLASVASGVFQEALLVAGRQGEARAELQRSRSLGVNVDPWLELIPALLGRSATEGDSLRRVKAGLLRADGKLSWPFEGQSPDLLDDLPAVRAMLRRVAADPASQSANLTARLVSFAEFFGDKDLAFLVLRSSLFELRNTHPLALWRYPALRADPRFKELVRELGLVDYWRQSGNWGDFCKPVGDAGFECH